MPKTKVVCYPLYAASTVRPFFPEAEANLPTSMLLKAYAVEYHCTENNIDIELEPIDDAAEAEPDDDPKFCCYCGDLLVVSSDVNEDTVRVDLTHEEAACGDEPRFCSCCGEPLTEEELTKTLTDEEFAEQGGRLARKWVTLLDEWEGRPPKLNDLVITMAPDDLAQTLAETPFMFVENPISEKVIPALMAWSFEMAPANLSKAWKYPHLTWFEWLEPQIDWQYIAAKLKEEDKLAWNKTAGELRLAELVSGRPNKQPALPVRRRKR